MAIQTVGAIMEVNGLIDSYKFTEGSKLEIGDKSFYPDYAIWTVSELWNVGILQRKSYRENVVFCIICSISSFRKCFRRR